MKRTVFTIVLFVFSLVSITSFAAGPAYNWTGFYAGLQGSYITGSSDWYFTDAGTSTDHTINGGMGGLFVGFNYQTPINIVVGIESDIGVGEVFGSDSCPNASYDCKSKAAWLGATRFRFGYAIDRFLPYIGIGIAYTEMKIYGDDAATGVEYASTKDAYVGWTPAIGFDFVITKNLLANFEYAYYDFGKEKVVLSDGERVENEVKFHGFKLGLSWKF